jgi:hypothetical protein
LTPPIGTGPTSTRGQVSGLGPQREVVCDVIDDSRHASFKEVGCWSHVVMLRTSSIRPLELDPLVRPARQVEVTIVTVITDPCIVDSIRRHVEHGRGRNPHAPRARPAARWGRLDAPGGHRPSARSLRSLVRVSPARPSG